MEGIPGAALTSCCIIRLWFDCKPTHTAPKALLRCFVLDNQGHSEMTKRHLSYLHTDVPHHEQHKTCITVLHHLESPAFSQDISLEIAAPSP